MRILGIDPGFGRIGWGVIDIVNRKPIYVGSGLIETIPKIKIKSLDSKEKKSNIKNSFKLSDIVINPKGSHGLKLNPGEVEIPINLRFLEIYSELTKVLHEFKPDEISIEELFFFKNQKTVINVAQSRGVIIMTCLIFLDGLSHKIHEFTPLQIKNAITGFGRAEKTQISYMINKILKINTNIKVDDTIDALAIALTYFYTGC